MDLTTWLGHRYQPYSLNKTVSYDSGVEQLQLSLQYQYLNSSWTVGSDECESDVANDTEFDYRLKSRRASLSNLKSDDSHVRKLSRHLSVNIPKIFDQSKDLRREVLNYNFHEKLKMPKDLVPVAKNTSSILKVDLVRCDCGVCGHDRSTSLGRFVEKMFDTYVANRNGRSYYWDESNGREMYESVVRVFRMLLGLWLRHHNHGKVQ